jgi:hypothetical protein
MVEQKARSSLAYVVEHLMLFLFHYPLRLPPASRARLPLKPLMKAKPSLNSRRLYKLGLRTSGNKEQLIERLRRATTASNDISKAKNEVRAFLGSAGTVADDERPFINGLYKSNFNLVDHFNQLLAGIEYRCRIPTEAQRVIISVAQFAVTVCYVLCEDNRQRSVRYPPVPTSVRAFALELAMSLMRSEEPFLKSTSEE